MNMDPETTSAQSAEGGGASMAPQGEEAATSSHPTDEIDDQGTDQEEASQILRELRDEAFDSSDEKLALALGRSSEEITQWIDGQGMIDADVLMKAKGLAIKRGVEIE
jgi:hypothetical protein